MHRFAAEEQTPDGTPVEAINDRNRYRGVSMSGHFGFSNPPTAAATPSS